MKSFIYALLLAISALPVIAQSSYSPDFSNTSIFNPSLWNPKIVSGSYEMTPADLVLVVNTSTSATITLPNPCQPGWVREIVNASPFYESNGTTLTNVTVEPGGQDVWISPVSAGSAPGAWPQSINSGGTTTFRAIGQAGVCIGWSSF